MAIQVEVWGDYACFTRPEMKTERVSYDVMTPSAARGLLESIYWHPGLRWVIDRIHVCAPIRFTNIRRNEVKDVISARRAKTVMEKGQGELYLAASESIQQRAAMVLRDVHYVIDAHFDMTDAAAPGDNPGKFQDIIKRRLEKGQCYSMPYFGTREFPAQFRRCTELPPCPDELKGTRDLGWVLWDLDYRDPANITPKFFRASLVDGVMTVPPPNSGDIGQGCAGRAVQRRGAGVVQRAGVLLLRARAELQRPGRKIRGLCLHRCAEPSACGQRPCPAHR